MNWKRLAIALLVGALAGVFCAYGTSELDPEEMGFEIDDALLITTFYNRLLIGLVVGLAGGVVLLNGVLANAALRGLVLGAVVSVAIGFYGGMEILVLFGAIYGLIADVVATKFGGEY
ncbi:hypothetical protein GF412_05085 [Candidatus Micrarchaeota archaeon]|nr:hypothetical protein [Candidatus Micrarchaeota archaeon]MBD3418328.1 hypothetical protein [Candidatus Micrarchaeota archaeon]